MNDAPIQTVLQQRDARPIPGEHLELLGKKAASEWVQGKVASLHEAVVGAVRGERLSPEQVCRVVEFANGDAYLQEFRKEGGAHRVVHFDHGPADPAQVLQDLNDGGGGSLYDRGTLDYQRDPESVYKAAQAGCTHQGGCRCRKTESVTEKTASVEDNTSMPKLPKSPSLPKAAADAQREQEFWDMFQTGGGEKIAFANPMRPLEDVRQEIAGARDKLAHLIEQLELDYAEAGHELYREVKQASLAGTSLGDMVRAWSSVNEDPIYVKIAFQMLTPRLRREGVHSLESLGESLQKVASDGTPDPEHPLMSTYAEFVGTLNKLASARALHEEFALGVTQATTLLKQAAAGGLLGAAKRGISAAGHGIDAAAPGIARVLVGPEGARDLAPTLATGLKATGLVGAGLVGNAAVQSVTDRPAVQRGLEAVQSVVPGTAAYEMRRYRNMTGQ